MSVQILQSIHWRRGDQLSLMNNAVSPPDAAKYQMTTLLLHLEEHVSLVPAQIGIGVCYATDLGHTDSL